MADDFKDLGFEAPAADPFGDVGFQTEPTKPGVQPRSQIESALRGAAQGLTFNFADELDAAVGTGAALLTGKVDPTVDDFVNEYHRQHELYSNDYQQARSDNPLTYTGANVATSIASPLNKMGMVASGAAMGVGAAQDMGQDALKQGLIGGGLGVLGGAVGNVAAKAAPAAERAIVSNSNRLINAASTGVGGMIGGVPGALVGQGLAKTVGRVAKPVIRSGAQKISDLLQNNPNVLGRFLPTLQAAAQRGPEALNASVFVLKQRDPEFRAITDPEDERDR